MSLGVAHRVSKRAAQAPRRASAKQTPRPQEAEASELPPDSLGYTIGKRALDLVVSATALAATSPIMVLLSLAIKLESRGPVFFGHVRLGKHGKPFRCFKFRTMRDGAHEELLANPELRRRYVENDFKVPLEQDPRITRIGRFLRKSSLDELPQLFNVLAGSMSLVGPRPIVDEELHWYGGDAYLLLSVKPGITGVWQVQGRNRIGYPERTRVELEGIVSRSLWSDMKVLVRSIPAVITARGSM